MGVFERKERSSAVAGLVVGLLMALMGTPAAAQGASGESAPAQKEVHLHLPTDANCQGESFQFPVGPLSHYLNPALVGFPDLNGLPPDNYRNYGETQPDDPTLVNWGSGGLLPTDCVEPHWIQAFFEAAFLGGAPLFSEMPGGPPVNGLWYGSLLLKYENGRIVPNYWFDNEDMGTVVDYDVTQAFRVPWRVPKLPSMVPNKPGLYAEVERFWEYRARYVTLPSGAQALILAPGKPGTGQLSPHGAPVAQEFELQFNSPCPTFDQDVLYFIEGTHGNPYYRNFIRWNEIEDFDTQHELDSTLGSLVNWWRDGSVVREALQRGMTVVYPEWSIGRRPILWSLAQIIELDRFINSDSYINEFTRLPAGNDRVKHRSFIAGGSFGGHVTLWAALYLDWIFQGALMQGANADVRQVFAWQEAYSFLRGFFNSKYNADKETLTKDPYMRMLVNELEKGIGSVHPEGLVGKPVDLAGLSLWSQDLSVLTDLDIPLTVVLGDEDYLMHSFLDPDLATLTGGLVIEERVPFGAHFDAVSYYGWNKEEKVLGQLVDRADCSERPMSPNSIAWSVETPGGAPHRSAQFYEEMLRPDFTPPLGQVGISIDRVVSGEWPDREVTEGLAASGSLVMGDVALGFGGDGEDGLPEIFAATARGDVVSLGFDPTDERWRPRWRQQLPDTSTTAPSASFFGHAELLWPDIDSNVIAAQHFGSLVEIDPLTGATAVLQTPGNQPLRVGQGLHSLREIPAGVVPMVAAGSFIVLNDEGELAFVSPSGPDWTSVMRYIEGGMLDFEPFVDGSTSVYSSIHGSLKRKSFQTAPIGFGHPTDPADIGDYLQGFVSRFQRLPGPVAPIWRTYLAIVRGYAGPWRVSLFDQELREDRAILSCVGAPPTDLTFLRADSEGMQLFVTWDSLPAELAGLFDGPGILAMSFPSSPVIVGGEVNAEAGRNRDTGAASSPVEIDPRLALLQRRKLDRSFQDHPSPPTFRAIPFDPSVVLSPEDGVNGTVTGTGTVGAPELGVGVELCEFDLFDGTTGNVVAVATGSPVSTIERVPAGSTLVGQFEGQPFDVEWIAALHSGQIVMLANPIDPLSPLKLKEPLPHQIVGEALGSAFGLDVIEADGELLVLGPQGEGWRVDPLTGELLADVPNLTGKELADPFQGRRAHYGGAWVDGSAFQDGIDRAFGMYDGGDVRIFGEGTPVPQALVAFPAAEIDTVDSVNNWAGVKVMEIDRVTGEWNFDASGEEPLAPAGRLHFRSELIVSPSCVDRPEPGPSEHHGNFVRFADLDGNPAIDLIAGTHGGQLRWFRNVSPLGFSVLPADNAGTNSLDTGGFDLGLRIIGLEVARLPGEDHDVIFVGIEADTNAQYPTQLTERASVYAFEVDASGQLVERGRLPIGWGIYGLRFLSNPFGALNPKDYLVATRGGRVHLLEVARLPNQSISLVEVAETNFQAPLLGAYNSIAAFPMTPDSVRLIMGSSGGLFAFDLVLDDVVPTEAGVSGTSGARNLRGVKGVADVPLR